MNLTENKDLLKNALQKADKNNYDHLFLSCKVNAESYYVDYENRRHMSRELMGYDFENVAEFKRYLDEVWDERDDLDYQIIKPVLLRILMANMDQEEKLVGDVELYNYTI